jgi:hypothetical protein
MGQTRNLDVESTAVWVYRSAILYGHQAWLRSVRSSFRDWDGSPTSAHRIFFSELSGTMYAICG